MRNFLMRSLLFLSLLLLLSCPAFPQTNINWDMLADLGFVEKYDEGQQAYEYFPEFSDALKKLEGKDVAIKGFMLPVDPDNEVYVLSRNPLASCFFCGNGGMESVVELVLKPGYASFKQDEVVTISGKLRLNVDDFEHLVYILEGAARFSPKE